ncbi:MAG: HD domain-containing protein [Gaiellales bacterium]
MGGVDTYRQVMEEWDPELADHAARVAAHAEAIAHRLGWTRGQIETLRLGAVLHDVGKVSIRASVLAKPGSLDPAELAEMRTHPVEGLWLIIGMPALAPALPYVLFHHERWDGSGYPTRRRGTDIPIEGRVLAVADAFDAMTTDRPYRPAMSIDEAVEELHLGAGSQFDPQVTQALLDVVRSGAHGVPALAVA